jgi:hypothetical protein
MCEKRGKKEIRISFSERERAWKDVNLGGRNTKRYKTRRIYVRTYILYNNILHNIF